jgi:hypothetical protein
MGRLQSAIAMAIARMLPIGPGPWGSAVRLLVPSDMYEGTFAKKNRVRGSPAPPGGPPVLGCLVWRAEGGRAA